MQVTFVEVVPTGAVASYVIRLPFNRAVLENDIDSAEDAILELGGGGVVIELMLLGSTTVNVVTIAGDMAERGPLLLAWLGKAGVAPTSAITVVDHEAQELKNRPERWEDKSKSPTGVAYSYSTDCDSRWPACRACRTNITSAPKFSNRYTSYSDCTAFCVPCWNKTEAFKTGFVQLAFSRPDMPF